MSGKWLFRTNGPHPHPSPGREERGVDRPLTGSARGRGFAVWTSAQGARCKPTPVAVSLTCGNRPAPTLACRPEPVEGPRLTPARFAMSSTLMCHPEPAGEGSRPSLVPVERVRSRRDARTRRFDLLRCVTREPSTSLRMTRETGSDLGEASPGGGSNELARKPLRSWTITRETESPRHVQSPVLRNMSVCTSGETNEILRLRAQNNKGMGRAPGEGLGVRALSGVRAIPR